MVAQLLTQVREQSNQIEKLQAQVKKLASEADAHAKRAGRAEQVFAACVMIVILELNSCLARQGCASDARYDCQS